MSKVEDVVRWSADPDAPAGMRELVRAANAADDGPSAEAIASMRGQVAAQLAPKVALLSVRALVVGLLVVGAGAGIVGYAVSRSDHPARVEPSPVTRREPPPVAPPPRVIAPTPPVIAPTLEEPAPALATAPAVPAPRVRVTPPKPAVHAAPPEVEVAPPPAPPPAPPISEVTLLEQARVALRGGDSTRALELADQHATSYPDGALAEEREALAIEALAKLGRRDEATAKWTKFASSYPHSNYRARLQRLIEIPR
ncbi:MAG TPA: hypothetical protein VFQ65_20470 [Kofleriaceae bacterium]|nr:hypothetical protein [Kofleriaceae bacterium]